MSKDYIRRVFDIMDGKLTFSNVDKKKRGRKAGYHHTKDTKDKIAGEMRGRVKDEETKAKISKSLQGVPKPEHVKIKISERKKLEKNSIAADLFNCYSGSRKEKDISTPTAEWLGKCGYDKKEVCKWISTHYKEFGKSKGICSESELKEGLYKGFSMEEIEFFMDDWR